MAIKEHPGWKEFPLETGQAVRADQINALYWALSERGAAVNVTPIETNFGVFDSGGIFVRYEGGDRATLVKGAGKSQLRAFDHLELLKTRLVETLKAYANPNNFVDVLVAPIAFNWSVSDILKDLKIGGPITAASGVPSSLIVSTTDPNFEFTIVPDRPGEIIGKDKDGKDVLFNDFFGPASFGRIVPKDTPTFKEHLNEIYFIIKRLRHIPLLGTGAGRLNVVGGSAATARFDTPSQDDAYRNAWDIVRSQLITDVGAGFLNTGSQSGGAVLPGLFLNAEHFRFTDPPDPKNELEGKFTFDILSSIGSASIPIPVFPGQIGENNDLPNPYVYGEVKIIMNVSEGFTFDKPGTGEEGDGEEPSFAEGIITIIKTTDSKVGSDVDIITQGEKVFEFPIKTKFPTPLPPGFGLGNQVSPSPELDLSNVKSILPVAEFSGDPNAITTEEFDKAISVDFNIYVGEDLTGDFTNVGPPNNLNSNFLYRDIRRFVSRGTIRGFFEITNWTHVDRERDPLPPNVPSGLESF